MNNKLINKKIIVSSRAGEPVDFSSLEPEPLEKEQEPEPLGKSQEPEPELLKN